jgi:hypothetical protein
MRSAIPPTAHGSTRGREGAVKWLAAHQGWLLILDNASDPAGVACW